MKKKTKIFLTFIILFALIYFILGYVIHQYYILIHWNDSATIYDKLREYYITDWKIIFIPTFIVAAISTTISSRVMHRKL